MFTMGSLYIGLSLLSGRTCLRLAKSNINTSHNPAESLAVTLGAIGDDIAGRRQKS